MSDEYTPTIAQVKEGYSLRGWVDEPEAQEEKGWQAQYRRGAEFDRWLAEHDRQVKAEALREAANGAEKAARDWRESASDPMNPSGSAEWDRRNAEARESAARWLRARAASIGNGEI